MIPLDPHFYRTVILITDHEEELGTSGLVLNQPIPEDYQAMMSKLISGNEMKSRFLTGGPVGTDQAFCLIDTSNPFAATASLPAGRELLPGVHQPADFEEALEAASSHALPEERLHFFADIRDGRWASWSPNCRNRFGSWLGLAEMTCLQEVGKISGVAY